MIEINAEISDENEFPPTFSASYAVVNVSENAKIGDLFDLDHCRATDKDSSKIFNDCFPIELKFTCKHC